jgi:hypothetical protein
LAFDLFLLPGGRPSLLIEEPELPRLFEPRVHHRLEFQPVLMGP